jgi:CDP-diacylglycerol--serine O-phosphatidyltransferase
MKGGNEGFRRLRRRRVLPVLPSILTTASLCFGLLSIMSSLQAMYMASGGNYGEGVLRKFWWAAVCVLVAGIFDLLDGRVARFFKAESSFGIYYDSLSDVISFGVAPAVLVFSWTLIDAGKVGVMSAIFYVVCTALRLARFNVQSTTVEKFGFTGLPSPAGAALVITPVLLLTELGYLPGPVTTWYFLLASPVIGLLMVSDIRYPKGSRFLFRRSFNSILVSAILIAAVVVNPEVMLFVLAYAYGAGGLIRHLVGVLRRRRAKLDHPLPRSLD